MKKPLVVTALVFSILSSLSSPVASQAPVEIQQPHQDVKKQRDIFDSIKNSSRQIFTTATALVIAGVASAIAAHLNIKLTEIQKTK